VLSGMGTAMMGTGEASGDQRAIVAAKDAIFNPLLDDVSLRGARSLLLSIAGGLDLTLFEVHDAVDVVRQELDPEANIIFGATVDDSMTGKIRVSIVASGMHRAQVARERGAGAAADQQAAAGGRAKEPSRADAASRREDTRSPAQTLARAANGAVWSGPGDVVIRERTPGSRSQSSAREDRTSARGDDLARLSVSPSGNQPPRRPMPTVEDFPLVGQREYWAKTAGARRGQPAPRQSEPPSRRMGLLERITGARRAKANAGQATAERPVDEQLDMPVFFRREQKD
jgi:cell division protein FtsZ